MNLDHLAVRLRRRTGWEAADLGIRLAAAWPRAVLGPWWCVAAPVAFLAIALFGGWGFAGFWFLLPLLEPLVLDPLSRAVFGDAPTLGETLRRAPRLTAGSWRELFLRRLSPSRTLALSIAQLEGLQGARRRARHSILAGSLEVAGALPFVFVLLQICLLASLFALLSVLTPPGLGIEWSTIWERFFEGDLPAWGSRGIWAAAAMVPLSIHPLLVAAGFGLYLDRRTVLEGWDLEIAFRRLARRLEGTSAAVVLVLLLSGPLAPGPARAEPPTTASATTTGRIEIHEVEEEDATRPVAHWTGERQDDPRHRAREIVRRPEFGGSEKRTVWRIREDLLERFEDQEDDRVSRPPIWLEALLGAVVGTGEVLVWGLLGLGLVVLAVTAARSRRKRPSSPESAPVPESLFGLDLRTESLPEDVGDEARQLWSQGRRTAALGLLYRAVLSHLARAGMPLREGFTEADCLRVAGSHVAGDALTYFGALTAAWQEAAYAHREPTGDGDAWWEGWRRHFGREPA